MNLGPFQDWLSTANLLVIVGTLFAASCVAALVGGLLRRRHERRRGGRAQSESAEGYVVSAVLGLLALLMGFTFSLAVDRFDARRHLVLDEANAIGALYLRAQLLTEPHRTRMSDILVRYTDNRITLAKARPGKTAPLLVVNDALVTDIWTAAGASFDSIKGLDFSSTYLDSVNQVIDLDASRKTARLARVPAEVFAVLFVYIVTAAGVLGYAVNGLEGQLAGVFLIALLILSLALIIDIDRPTLGGVVEGQGAMERLYQSMKSQPRSIYDRWKTPAPQA